MTWFRHDRTIHWLKAHQLQEMQALIGDFLREGA
jgi:hypothetical protein